MEACMKMARIVKPAHGGRRFALAGSALVLAAGVAAAPSAAAAARPAASSSCAGQKATGPFRINPGNHSQVIGADGKVFVSYGITVPGLVGTNWKATKGRDPAKITATAEDWCGNTVRLQVSQDNLLGTSGKGFDQSYMTAIESEVRLAERYHLVVVLNDSTESAPSSVKGRQLGPTTATEIFWKDMTRFYGRDPQVIFDLFNEPRENVPVSGSLRELWLQWRNGAPPYLGMETLARYVRARGARNLLWVEGPLFSVSFEGMQRYGGLLAGVGPVVYAIHHPDGLHDRAAWFRDFGYLINDHIAPVVDGEWTNYEPAPTRKPQPVPTSCWLDAPASIVNYLSYLHTHGVGMSAYQLAPNLLIKSYSNYAVPTTINPSTWSCLSDDEVQPGQGAGTLIRNWFRKFNG
jgi:hypothetical protein